MNADERKFEKEIVKDRVRHLVRGSELFRETVRKKVKERENVTE
jgi:hypothetical protein